MSANLIPNALPTFDFGLGETADQLRQSVRSFAARESQCSTDRRPMQRPPGAISSCWTGATGFP